MPSVTILFDFFSQILKYLIDSCNIYSHVLNLINSLRVNFENFYSKYLQNVEMTFTVLVFRKYI